jgi:hypothetical protein
MIPHLIDRRKSVGWHLIAPGTPLIESEFA